VLSWTPLALFRGDIATLLLVLFLHSVVTIPPSSMYKGSIRGKESIHHDVSLTFP